jgi:hypothetical protein
MAGAHWISPKVSLFFDNVAMGWVRERKSELSWVERGSARCRKGANSPIASRRLFLMLSGAKYSFKI